MKKLLLLPILLVFLALPTAVRADQKDDDAAIHQRHDEWCAAWNKHDAKLMAGFFLPDGDLINPFGVYAKGTEAIEKLFTSEHTGSMAGTTYSGTIENIRYIGKNVAIIDVAAEVAWIKGSGGASLPPFKHHVTWIAEKKAGKWMAIGARVLTPMTPPAAK